MDCTTKGKKREQEQTTKETIYGTKRKKCNTWAGPLGHEERKWNERNWVCRRHAIGCIHASEARQCKTHKREWELELDYENGKKQGIEWIGKLGDRTDKRKNLNCTLLLLLHYWHYHYVSPHYTDCTHTIAYPYAYAHIHITHVIEQFRE